MGRKKKGKAVGNPVEEGKAVRNPVEEGEDRSRKTAPPTSRNREESMTESGNDEFQNPRSSGTTSLGGESQESDPDPEQVKHT